MPPKARGERTADAGTAALTNGALNQAKTSVAAAEDLVRAHRAQDPKLEAYFATAPNEVQLIEVTPSVADTDEVVSFRFAGNEDFELAYDLRLIMLNPAEWERLRSGKLKLPRGWCPLSQFEKIAA